MSGNKEPKESELKLELVQVVFRHGARTPIPEELDLYKFNDISAYKAIGLGQLTTAGKKMEYDLGVFLRKRYKNFLSEQYVPEELYAYSTDTHRTKMSLQLVLAGLYPPVGRDVWNPQLKWSPVPYTHAPVNLDIVFLYFDKPSYQKLRSEAYKSKEFRKRVEGFSDFLAYLTSKTKVNFDDDFFHVVSLYGIIIADESLNLPLPDWFNPEVREKFVKLISYVWDGWTFTLKLKKLVVGLLIKTLVDNMNLKGADRNPRKLYLYSAHDANVTFLMKTHGEFIYPDYGCGLILEKLRDSANRVYVRLLFRSGTGNLTPMKLGKYKEFCPIDEYLKLVEAVIPTEKEVDAMLEDVSVEKLRKALYYDSVL